MTTGEQAVTSSEASEAGEARALTWTTYQTEAGQVYTMNDRDPAQGHEVCVGFVLEHRDGLAQAFLSTDPNKEGSALLVSAAGGTDVDTAIDALEGAYAARQHEQESGITAP